MTEETSKAAQLLQAIVEALDGNSGPALDGSLAVIADTFQVGGGWVRGMAMTLQRLLGLAEELLMPTGYESQ